MDVLNIDWKNIDSRFVRDEFYEDIRAPKWLDFLALEEPVDDDAWFCKPDCNHPRTAASFLDDPLFESPKVKQPRSVRFTSVASISSNTPLGDRIASTLDCKKTRGPLLTSETSLYELKAKENASRNLKNPSPADRNKHAFRTGKYVPGAENDNPNHPRSSSSVASSGKKRTKKQIVYNTTTPVKTPESSEKEGVRSPTRITKLTSKKTSTSDHQSSSLKSRSAIKDTFSDCNHPRIAASLLDAPLFELPKVKQPRSVRSTSAASISSNSPLGDRTASTLYCKKTRGLLLTSETSLYELKGNENASMNLKKPSPADRNKHAFRTGKYLPGTENYNPNHPRSSSSIANSEKKRTKKQIVYNTTTPVKTPESSEKKGVRSPTRITKLTSKKTSASDNQSSSLKSCSAIKGTFSAGYLFGKTLRKDYLTHLSEFCSKVKKVALYGGQKDSAKQSNMAFKHDSDEASEEKGKQNQEDKNNCSDERSSLSGSKDQQVMKNSIIDDPDKCSKSGPMEIGGLQLRNNKRDAAKSCSKSGVKKDNLSSSKQPKLDEEDFSSHTENMVSDTSGNMLTNLSALHEHGHDYLEKVENIKHSGDPFLELSSGLIHSHEQENTALSGDPQLEKCKESSKHLEKGFTEPHKKSSHAKIFNPSSWKKKRTDGVEQRHPTNKYSWNAGQKVESCPPSRQQVCRLYQTSSSSSQSRKSTTTPRQPFQFRTSERGALREKKKLQRSLCADNVVASPELKQCLPDVFSFLKCCA